MFAEGPVEYSSERSTGCLGCMTGIPIIFVGVLVGWFFEAYVVGLVFAIVGLIFWGDRRGVKIVGAADHGEPRVVWWWGLFVPFWHRDRPIGEYDRVEVRVKDELESISRGMYSAHLMGSDSLLLAKDRDYDAIRAEARDVARQFGLSLDDHTLADSRRKHFESSDSLAPPTTTSQLVPHEPPESCRVEIEQTSGGVQMDLPSPGFDVTFLSWALPGLAMAAIILLGFPWADPLGHMAWAVVDVLLALWLLALFFLPAIRHATKRERVTITRNNVDILTRVIGCEELSSVRRSEIKEAGRTGGGLRVAARDGHVDFGGGLSDKEAAYVLDVIRFYMGID